MRVIQVEEKFDGKDPKPIRLWPIGDTHLGAIDTDEATLRQHIEEIKNDPQARIIFMGDIGDLITHRDPRWQAGMWAQRYIDAMHHEGGLVTETVHHAVEIFEPVRDKIWAWLSGNHERSVRRHTDREIGSEICAGLKISHKYLGWGGFVRVRWQRKSSTGGPEVTTVFDLAHGWQAGRRPGSKLNQLELELSCSDADIILRGHSHERVAQIIGSLRVTPKRVQDWPRIVAHTGTYKMGWTQTGMSDEDHSTWEETKGFRKRGDSMVGPPIIEITPSVRKEKDGVATIPSTIDYRVIL
jgi:predicted phosphodiesterase